MLDSKLTLLSKTAPDRAFDLNVTTLDKPTKMVWEDGGKIFQGSAPTRSLPSPAGRDSR